MLAILVRTLQLLQLQLWVANTLHSLERSCLMLGGRLGRK